jgi:hypothetical protein
LIVGANGRSPLAQVKRGEQMNINRRIYFYKGKLPLYFFPLIFFGLIAFAILVILGLFVGVILGTIMVGFILIRLLIPSGKKKTNQVEEDSQTVTLKEGEYEVIEKGRKS